MTAGDQIQDRNWIRVVACSSPATPAARGPVRYGVLTGIALTAEGDGGNAATDTTVDFGPRQDALSVKGIDDNGSSAVIDGDTLFYVDADTPHLSKKSTGYLFGIARGAVSGNATTTILVDKVVTPGAPGVFGAGSIGATELATSAVTTVKLAANAVTTAKLTATLGTGFIDLALTDAVLLSSNAVQNTTEGGRLDGNTAPTLTRANGATDIALLATWAASGAAEIQWARNLPPDLDDAGTIVVHLWIEKDTNTDSSAVVAVKLFQGKGDANAGGNTAALGTATLSEYTVTMAAGDVLAQATSPFLNIALVPGTHTTDAIRLYAAYLTYTRI
jgi:hypothetical protein